MFIEWFPFSKRLQHLYGYIVDPEILKGVGWEEGGGGGSSRQCRAAKEKEKNESLRRLTVN